jgi:branched-chain amino acid transport system substrate-binding protein
MGFTRRHLMAASAASLAVPYVARAASRDPILIGEVNSYAAFPTFTMPYRNAMVMAVEEINSKGGVSGRPLKLITKDDGANPQDAIRAATELVRSDRVNVLAGGFLSNVGLALSSFAKHSNTLYVASEALANELTWQDGNANTFRLTPSIYMLVAMMIDDAAKLPATKWATVAPNYSYGTSAVKTFQKLLKAKRPDVTFVAEQWPTLDQINAPATVAALAAAKPDGIFNATFASDLVAFVRQGNTTGLFKNRSVVSLLTGEPEYLDSLGSDTPDGWIVTGYPSAAYTAPGNEAFVTMYKNHFKDDPDWGAVIGYTLIHSIAAGVGRSKGLSLAELEQGFAGVTFPTPFGQCQYRAIDHQSTLGAFVGKLAQKGGKGTMVDFRYVDGASVLPPDSVVEKLRPKS